MKISLIIRTTLYALVATILGGLTYQLLFKGGGSGASGLPYGNLWLRYSVEGRGLLGPKVQSLIASPEMPTNQTYSGKQKQWTYTFANGRTFTFSLNSENLIWVDPLTGPVKLPTTLTNNLIEQIEQTQKQAREKNFENGTHFLTWLRKTNSKLGSQQ